VITSLDKRRAERKADKIFRDLLAHFRDLERSEPTWPKFDETTLPKREPGEDDYIFACRRVQRLVEWTAELKRVIGEAKVQQAAANGSSIMRVVK
jgi:hypothetical protein